jgi:hypothetical protein
MHEPSSCCHSPGGHGMSGGKPAGTQVPSSRCHSPAGQSVGSPPAEPPPGDEPSSEQPSSRPAHAIGTPRRRSLKPMLPSHTHGSPQPPRTACITRRKATSRRDGKSEASRKERPNLSRRAGRASADSCLTTP